MTQTTPTIEISEVTISDWAPTESEANIVPHIRGEVISDSIKPYRAKRRLNTEQKFLAGVLTFVLVFVGAILLLPWVLKFALIVSIYIAIAVVSTGSFTVASRGGRSASVPGSSIVPRS
jgi:hypothetical protein